MSEKGDEGTTVDDGKLGFQRGEGRFPKGGSIGKAGSIMTKAEERLKLKHLR